MMFTGLMQKRVKKNGVKKPRFWGGEAPNLSKEICPEVERFFLLRNLGFYLSLLTRNEVCEGCWKPRVCGW